MRCTATRGIADLEIVVDAHERYPYRFRNQQVRTVQRAVPCGGYGLVLDGRLVALPRAAVVVEDRYSEIFKLERFRPAEIADGLAELQVRWSEVPIVFCETR